MTPTSLVKKVNPLSELHLNLDFGEVGPLFSPDVGARCASPQTLTTYVWTPPSLLSASAPAAANALMVPTTTRGLPGLVCRAQMHFHCCVPAYCHNLFIYSPAARGLITLLLCAVMFPHTCHGVYGRTFPGVGMQKWSIRLGHMYIQLTYSAPPFHLPPTCRADRTRVLRKAQNCQTQTVFTEMKWNGISSWL